MPRRGQYLKGGWADRSLKTVKQVVADLPPGTPAADAKRAVSAAYPFGEREYTPYKIWLQVTNEYLRLHYPELRAAHSQKQLNRAGVQTRAQASQQTPADTSKRSTGQGELLGMEELNGPAP